MSITNATKTLKRSFALVLAIVMMLALVPTTAMAADYDNHWSRQYIEDAKSRGWMNGYEDGTFRPDNSITRAEFASMLWRALDEPKSNGGSPFYDTAADAWYSDAVAALYEAGIVSGVGDGSFAPSNTLTREMAFTMLTRAFGFEVDNTGAYSQFSDSGEISAWAQDGVSALAERGYISGVGSNQCAPKKALTRGEMAKLLITVFDGESAPAPTITPDDPAAKDADKSGPEISLSYSPTASTTGKVTITVKASDDSGVAYIGKRASSSGATYTGSNGFTNITSASSFTVSTNGWYAVCATDELGNFSYELIHITNISGSSSSGSGGTVGTTTISVTGVTVSPTSAALTVGATQTLAATVTPSNATNKSVTWTSSDTSVATVSSSGVVTAVAAGTATITVKTSSGGYTATCIITVSTTIVPVTGVSISGTATVGETLTATVTPANATNVTYQWYVSDTDDNTGGTEISGATSNTYVVAAAYEGKYIYVVVGGDNSSTETTTQTTAIAPAPIAVTYSSAVADGTAGSATTTKVTLTFDKDITGLAVGDITVTAGTTGATKGTLTPNGSGVYELTLTGISGSGTITVAVAKAGYAISPASRTASVVFYQPPVSVAFSSAIADGNAASASTTKVTLTFDKDIAGLLASDITITANETGATRGALTRTGAGVYELTLTGITASGNITVAVAKVGYTITPSSISSVAVVYYTAPVVTVTMTGPVLGVYTYTVLIDGSAPSESYDLYIFNATTNTWIKAATGTSAPVQAPIEYANGSNCIVVLASATDRATISSNTNAMIGSEKNNSGYAPIGAGVYLTTITGS